MSEFQEKRGVILLALYGGLIVFLTFNALTGFKQLGEEINVFKFQIYIGILAFTIFLYLVLEFSKFEKFGLPLDPIVHSPEFSPYVRNTALMNPYTQFFVFLAIFSILSFVTVQFPQTFLGKFGQTSLPDYLQSVAPFQEDIGKFIFNVEPAASTETLGFLLVISIIVSILELTIFPFFGGLDEIRDNFFLFTIIGIILMIVGGWAWAYILHNFVYGASDIALQQTFFFGMITVGLWWFMGSVIPPLLYHIFNNSSISFLSIFGSSDTALLVLIGITLGSIVMAVISFSDTARARLLPQWLQ